MNKEELKKIIERLLLQIQILEIQIKIAVLKQKLTVPNLDNPKKIILHHSGAWANFEQTNEYHRKIWGWKSSLGFYIGYQYFIDRFGYVFQARRDREKGAHTPGQNKSSLGIALMGNGEEKDFTPEQYKAVKKLIDRKLKEYNISGSDVYGHRNFSPTLCPSNRLYQWILNHYRFSNL